MLIMKTRFDIVTVEIFTSYSNKRYRAGYWILALYKYIIIIIILLLPLVARCLETIDVCIWRMFVFMSVVLTVWGSVGMFVV